MPELSQPTISNHLRRGLNARTFNARGRALEDLMCYVFEQVPGIEIVQRNAMNAFRTEEIDIALWNNQDGEGFHFLPPVLLVECKNWRQPVGSQEVAYFATRMRHRGCDYGFLVAASGLTGIPEELTAAHFELATALAEGRRIILLTNGDLDALTHTDDLVTLVKRRMCELVVSGSVLVDAE